jgi:hypothetical protein
MRSKFQEHVEQSRFYYLINMHPQKILQQCELKNYTSDQITFCFFKSTASDPAIHLGIFSPYYVYILRVVKNQEFLGLILGLCEHSPFNAPVT